MGLSGRVPRRVDAVTKTALMDLVVRAEAGGCSTRAVCRLLELSQRRLERWRRRVADGEGLDDAAPGGSPVHGLTPDEQDEIVAVFNEWGDIDRSHRKLAHRGSWLGRFWADPSTVRRVLERRDLRFRGPKRQRRSARRPWPAWVEEAPNRIWIYDTTHWTRAGAATTVISDVISRKWIADVTSADETSIEVQAVFNRALRVEGLDEVIEQRNPRSTPWDPDCDEAPVLLVMSDNGPQMTSGTTRQFMALCWLATHFGRPGTPTDQAWIESLFGHLKIEQPHLELILTDLLTYGQKLAVIHRHSATRTIRKTPLQRHFLARADTGRHQVLAACKQQVAGSTPVSGSRKQAGQRVFFAMKRARKTCPQTDLLTYGPARGGIERVEPGLYGSSSTLASDDVGG